MGISVSLHHCAPAGVRRHRRFAAVAAAGQRRSGAAIDSARCRRRRGVALSAACGRRTDVALAEPMALAAEALACLEAAAVGLVARPVPVLAREGAVPDPAAAQARAGDVGSAARHAQTGIELHRAPPEHLQGVDGFSAASRGGGLHERLGALNVLGKAVQAVHVAHADVVPGNDVTSLDGFRPPLHRQRVVLLHALAERTAVGELRLRRRVPCDGGLAEPRHRSFSVLLHAVAV